MRHSAFASDSTGYVLDFVPLKGSGAVPFLHDEEITPDGAIPQGAAVRPYDAHDDAVGTVAEGRYYASEYLIRVAQAELKMRTHLLKAAGCYAQEHDLMWRWLVSRRSTGSAGSPSHR